MSAEVGGLIWMYRFFLKRICDLTICVAATPVLLVLIIIIGPLIYLEDRGSIFYVAPRLGKDGKVFNMYKFRSMKINAADVRNKDGSTFNSDDDPRLTRIGRFLRKTSLDETPQLLNVIKGEMSLVGPRPDLADQISIYEANSVHKLDVLPGITGYNQAYFRNSIPLKDRFANDLFYVKHVSFLLDLRIILKTVQVMLLAKNIYIDAKHSVLRK